MLRTKEICLHQIAPQIFDNSAMFLTKAGEITTFNFYESFFEKNQITQAKSRRKQIFSHIV